MADGPPRPDAPDGLAPDDALMRRCGQGDMAALEALLARHQDAAYRHCWRVFRNHHTAEDVVQEFFVKLFRHAARYEPQGHFTTWFYRVLSNQCLDVLRKRRRRSAVEGLQLDPQACEGTALEPQDGDEGAEARLQRAEQRDRVHAALAGLPVEVRRAVELRELDGLRYREVAEVLGLSLNEVKVLLVRGRKLLARALGASEEGRRLLAAAEAPPGRGGRA